MKRIGDIRPKPVQLSYRDYMAIARKSRRKGWVNRKRLDAPPMSRVLALKVFVESFFQELFFVDYVDVCQSHTTIHHSKDAIEVYPVSLLRFETRHNTTTVFYENDTSFEIIRLN